MRVTEGLEPDKVFEYFERICSIPHGSYNEKALSDYCVEFAKERNLKYYQDELSNVIIIKEASEGYEDSPSVILQGHLDMVCEKEPDSDIDFTRDGLKLKVEKGYLYADKTTLGGDDGIAVAYVLALLDSDDIPHPRIEAVFTVCEETGMEGAAGIDLSMLEGKMLINIDSEEEGCILASCAGGCHVSCGLSVRYKTISEAAVYNIGITGLAGGHSGCDIHKERANADILAGRLLMYLWDNGIDFVIMDINGGKRDNVIPSEAYVLVAVASDDGRINAVVSEFAKIIYDEYRVSDEGISINISKCEQNDYIEAGTLDRESTYAVIELINSLPDGVIAMSKDMPGMVETSLNLGIMSLDDKMLSLHYLLRSSKDSSLDFLAARIAHTCRAQGAEATISSRYPAWEYIPDSKLRRVMQDAYRDLYGKEPRTESIHAGVECGVLAAKVSGLDCVSFGPDIHDIHTPREHLDIASVQRTWRYLLEVLKRLK